MKDSVVLFVDAMSLIHRIFHAYPHLYDKNGQPTGVIYGLSRIFISLVLQLQPTYVIVAFDTPAPTFRHKEYKDYKAKRPAADPEMIAQLPAIKEMFDLTNSTLILKDGFEADDLIGSGINYLKKNQKVGRLIILSGDYDLAQLIEDDQVILNYIRGSIKGAQPINEAKFIDKWGFKPRFLVDYKALAGDQSDNIPGVPGIGKVTAQKLISRWQTIEKIYQLIQNQPEKVSQITSTRIVNLLKKGQEKAFFSKKLAMIKKDLQLKELNNLKTVNLNQARLKDFLRRYNFKSLLNQLGVDDEKTKEEKTRKQEKISQLSLL